MGTDSKEQPAMPGTGQVEFLRGITASIEPTVVGRFGQLVPPRAPPGAGPTPDRSDLLDLFFAELSLVGGNGHRARSARGAVERLLALVSAGDVRRVVLWRHRLLGHLGVGSALTEAGVEWWEVSEQLPEAERLARMAVAEMGITAVDYAIAETGSLVLCSRPGQARLVSLLPPLHVAFLSPDCMVVAGLETLLPLMRRELDGPGGASNIVCITGPSRTADIELSLTQGVHGPKEVHVIGWEEELGAGWQDSSCVTS